MDNVETSGKPGRRGQDSIKYLLTDNVRKDMIKEIAIRTDLNEGILIAAF